MSRSDLTFLQKYKAYKKEWAEFGDYVQEHVALVLQGLAREDMSDGVVRDRIVRLEK